MIFGCRSFDCFPRARVCFFVSFFFRLHDGARGTRAQDLVSPAHTAAHRLRNGAPFETVALRRKTYPGAPKMKTVVG